MSKKTSTSSSSPLAGIPEEAWRLYFENTPDMLCVIGYDQKFKLVNPTWSKVLGWSEDEFLNMGFLDLVHPDDLDETKATAIKHRDAKKTASSYQNRYRCKDGSYRWLLWHAIPSPEHKLFYGITRDITEFKQTEEDLRSEKIFTDIALNSQLDTFFLFEPDTGKAIRWNQAFNDITGYTDEEISSQKAPDTYYSPDDLKKATVFIEEVLNTGSGTIELDLICKDGRRVPTEYKVSVIKDSAGKPKHLISVGRDITKRKQAEEALKESEEKYRNLIERANDGIVIVQDGKMIFANGKLLDMLGYSHEEMINTEFLSYVPPDERARIADIHIRRIKGEDVPDIYEMTGICKDGTMIPIETNSGVITYQGKPSVLAFIRDISERKEAEEALKESEARFRSLSQATFEGISITEEGIFIDANEQLLSILGYQREDLIGNKIIDFIVPEYHQIVIESVAAKREDLYEVQAVCKDGRIIDVEVRPRFMEMEGRTLRLTAIRDVTERKKAEEALRESEEKYRNIVESSPMGMHMYQLEPDGRLVFSGANPIADTILGVDNNQFVGKTIEEAFTPLAETEIPQRYREAAAEGTPWYTEQITYEDEQIIGAFEVHAFQTSPGRMTALFLDITERKKAEEALQESEEKFRNIVEASPMGMHMYSLESDGRFVFRGANPAADNILGLDNSQFIGKTIEESFPSSAGTGLIERYRKAAAEGEPWFIEQNTYEDDKISGSFEVHAFQTAPGKMTALFLDITERKQAEEEIRKLNDELEKRVANRTAELEATNQELEAFAYSISHDLRAPLRAINSFSEILQQEYEERLDEEGKEYLSRVQANARRMNKLIDDLLALSRLGRKEMHCITANLAHIAKRVFVDVSTQDSDREIDFQMHDMPLVKVDTSLIEVALTNLLGNAVKFTRGIKPAKIRFGFQEREEGQVFYIKDNGVGFDMKYADKLFSPFQRLHTESEFEGTGIGLAIVHRIIQRHGGEIWVDSKPGEGTTFYFTLEANETRS
jgi:PAS domain S-box-containing protein